MVEYTPRMFKFMGSILHRESFLTIIYLEHLKKETHSKLFLDATFKDPSHFIFW